MAIFLSMSARNAVLDAIVPQLTTLDVYAGAIPATPGGAPGSAPLATFSVALPIAVSGTSWLGVPVTALCDVGGTAAWARWHNGLDMAVDGAVGVSNSPFVLSSLALSAGENITLLSLRLSQPAS